MVTGSHPVRALGKNSWGVNSLGARKSPGPSPTPRSLPPLPPPYPIRQLDLENISRIRPSPSCPAPSLGPAMLASCRIIASSLTQ